MKRSSGSKALPILGGIAAVLALVVVLGLIGGLLSQGDDKGEASTPTSAGPDTAYLEALAAIDPALAEGRSAVLDGKNICLDIEQGKTDDQLARNAAARYGIDATSEQVKQIVAAAREHLCP